MSYIVNCTECGCFEDEDHHAGCPVGCPPRLLPDGTLYERGHFGLRNATKEGDDE